MSTSIRKAVGIALAAALLAVALLAGWFYHQLTHFTHEQVAPDVWAVSGLGGNTGVLRTDIGTVLVDTMSVTFQGKKVRELAEQLTGKPVIMVINTHYHLDHTHGNPAMATDTRFVASRATRRHLLATEPEYWQDNAEFIPDETIEHEQTFQVGNKTIYTFIPGRGHTDGDLVVLFVDDHVVHVGDLMFHGRYPNIDLEAGGSVREWAASLDAIGKLEFERVIPGHGPVTDRDGIADFRALMNELTEAGARAASQGWTLEETLERTDLVHDAGIEEFTVPFVMHLDADFVVKRAWEEATGAVSARAD